MARKRSVKPRSKAKKRVSRPKKNVRSRRVASPRRNVSQNVETKKIYRPLSGIPTEIVKPFTMKKEIFYKPLIAAILNFFVWGAGFIYTGRTYYGFLWLFTAIFVMIPSNAVYNIIPRQMAVYLAVGYFLISSLLAIDAYFDAHNAVVMKNLIRKVR